MAVTAAVAEESALLSPVQVSKKVKRKAGAKAGSKELLESVKAAVPSVSSAAAQEASVKVGAKPRCGMDLNIPTWWEQLGYVLTTHDDLTPVLGSNLWE